MIAEDHIEDDPFDDEFECDCLAFELNLEGVAECMDCGRRWHASDEEIAYYNRAMRRHHDPV